MTRPEPETGREAAQATPKVTLHRHTARLEGLNIFYRDTETDGDAILCLHGRWGRGETWVDFMRRYGAEYRVIAPDLRGHGLSDKPVARYTAEEMALDMAALLDALGIDSAIVVGHSMGGHVAGILAADHPRYARALAILDKDAAVPAEPCALEPREIEPIDPVTKDWPLPFESLAEAQGTIRRDMTAELSYRYFMNSLYEAEDGYRMMFSAQAIAANIAYYRDWFDALPRIACPTLLVRAQGGEAVPDANFARMRRSIPNCRAYTMSEKDHNVHLSNPEEFYARFDEFLGIVVSTPRR